MYLIVAVKQEHIDKGKIGSRSCPVALAIKEQTGSEYVSIGHKTGFIKGFGHFELDDVTSEIIKKHDLFTATKGKEGKQMVPFSFETKEF